tara:strand:- start:96 stop:461 length:366 start_codon:yes stop_codon:yes gene_type:complete
MGTCYLFRNSNKELRRLPYFGLLVLLFGVSKMLDYVIEKTPNDASIVFFLIWAVSFPVGAYLALARGRNAGLSFQFVLWGWIPIWNIWVGLVLLFRPQPKNNNVNSALKLGDMPQKFKDFD